MYKPLNNVEQHLEKWTRKKYPKLGKRLARQLLGKIKEENPKTFYHWTLGLGQKAE
ncbi:MAG: hypothetical protein ABS251_03435 [Wolbachia endosymbiont of Ephestia elutella]|uniref:Uncharacterized protein n=1 Tax=Wolbachia endosymbiont of Ephestia elutella TaxID=3231696 RepID=A0AAU8MIW2_9RICK|nr:hypothetical protein [Wolbachia endosymbiont (group B) of Lycaena phlaeas]